MEIENYVIGFCIAAPIIFFISTNMWLNLPWLFPLNWILIIVIAIILAVSIAFIFSRMGSADIKDYDSNVLMVGCCGLPIICLVILYMGGNFGAFGSIFGILFMVIVFALLIVFYVLKSKN